MDDGGDPRQGLEALRAAYRSQVPAKVAAIEQAVGRAWDGGPDALEELYHLAHRLVGSAAVHQLDGLSRAARALEEAVDRLRRGSSSVAHAERSDVEALVDRLKVHATWAAEGSRPARVLLVDDDQDMLDFLSLHLRNAGLQVEALLDSEAALRRVEQDPPDVIVADVVMPRMTGYELCRRVRAAGLDEIPFIFCSALGAVPERILGLRMGADDYVVKPTEPDELVLKIRAQLERQRRLLALKERAEGAAGLLSGSLSDVPVPEVLQMVGLLELGDVRIRIQRSHESTGAVYLSGKQLIHAEIGDCTGRKAFVRLLGAQGGRFRVERGGWTGAPTLGARIEEALSEGLGQLDECRALRDCIAADGPYLVFQNPGDLVGRHFEPQAAEVLSLVEELHRLDDVLDASPLTDLETLRIVCGLLQTGVLSGRRERRPGTSSEVTP